MRVGWRAGGPSVLMGSGLRRSLVGICDLSWFGRSHLAVREQEGSCTAGLGSVVSISHVLTRSCHPTDPRCYDGFEKQQRQQTFYIRGTIQASLSSFYTPIMPGNFVQITGCVHHKCRHQKYNLAFRHHAQFCSLSQPQLQTSLVLVVPA